MISAFSPKIMSWSRQLDQHYKSKYQTLITSGCSFTASTNLFDGPSSWPGFVKDRCNIPLCVDLSFPGAGNEYIANSILAEIENKTEIELRTIFVIVCWSGLDRKENLECDNINTPNIDGVYYNRAQMSTVPTPEKWKRAEVWRSWKNIIFTKNYLENKKVNHAFVFYCNVFDPPFLPKRDLTPEWPKNISSSRITSLKQIPWAIPHNQSLFEFAFENDYLGDDLFHPTYQGNFEWTDKVLLPNLCKNGLISAI
jgi:hypothetical protein